MKTLIDRILKDGRCYPGGILKVDKFINHQMDPNLMKAIAIEFIKRYSSTEININHRSFRYCTRHCNGTLVGSSCCVCEEKESFDHGQYLIHYGILVYQATGI